jgi:hypothetical protein
MKYLIQYLFTKWDVAFSTNDMQEVTALLQLDHSQKAEKVCVLSTGS